MIKASTPDRDGDAIGGIINVVTKTAFELDRRELTLNGALTLNEEPDEWGYNGQLHYSDLFDLGDGEDNFDIQIEYYTDQGGLYSAAFFYKDVSDFTYTQVYDFDDIGADGIPIPADGGDLEYERPLNGSDAENYGLELIARQRFLFLPAPWDGFGISASATFAESDAEYPNWTDNRDLPLPRFSDTLYTASLDYAYGGFYARVDYRYRSDYIEGLGDDIESDEFYAAEERFDGEIRYRFNNRFMVYVNGTNLTDRPQLSYQGYPPLVEDASYSGRKYAFGAEFTF